MGVYDRDYYRNDPPGGGALGGVAPVCKWLIAINVAVFVLQLMTDDPRTGMGGITEWLRLSPDRVIHRLEIWRLVTCVSATPSRIPGTSPSTCWAYGSLAIMLSRSMGRVNFFGFT